MSLSLSLSLSFQFVPEGKRIFQVGGNVFVRNMETKENRSLGVTLWSHTHMGAGGFDNKHGVGILLNTKW